MRIIITALLLSATVSLPSVAEEIEVAFSYANPNKDLEICGMKKADTYDVAIRLDNDGLVAQGAKIVGVEIPVVNDANVGGYSAWVTSDLGTFNYADMPVPIDICSKEGEPENGVLSIRFDEPVVLPAGGLYVGYTFTVSSTTSMGGQYPVVMTREPRSGGLYMRCRNEAYNWQDCSKDFVSAMKVIVRGDFKLDAATPGIVRDVYSKSGESVVAQVPLSNCGVTEIKSIDYSYELDGQRYEETYQFKRAIPGIIGSESTFNAVLKAPETTGDHIVELRIDKVNGNDNSWEPATTKFHYVTVNQLPQRRILMEEFTGTWCQFCPRGMAGMEYVKENRPETILVAYHNNDVMQMSANGPFQMAWSYPCAYLDRVLAVDPLNGSSTLSTSAGYILEDIDDRMKVESPVSVELSSTWNDDRSELTINAEVTFIYTPTDGYDYRLGYVITEDGMKGDDAAWYQRNVYAGQTTYRGQLGLDAYVDLPDPITNMVYNEVAVYATTMLGLPNSLPGIVGGETIKHEQKVKIAKCVNYRNQPMIQDTDRLNVIAYVIRSKGSADMEILNANICAAGGNSGIEHPSAVAEAIGVEYYDLSGRKVAAPAKGIYIVVTRYSDGTSECSKVMY